MDLCWELAHSAPTNIYICQQQSLCRITEQVDIGVTFKVTGYPDCRFLHFLKINIKIQWNL
jgi:hypothetical protein